MYSLKLSRQTVLMAEAALESRGTAVLLQVITVFKKNVCKDFAIAENTYVIA